MAKNKTMLVASDLGYGDVKMVADDEVITEPSVFVQITDGDNAIPVTESSDDEGVKDTVQSLLSNLDITTGSKRYLIGDSANHFNGNKDTISVHSGDGKAKSELAFVSNLGLIAGKAVKEAYDRGEDIFKQVSTTVDMVTALPIEEVAKDGLVRGAAGELISKYKDNNHVVIINNFSDPVTVQIKFDDVQVMREGEIAIIGAIKNGSKDIQNSIKAYLNEHYPELSKYADALIKEAENIIGIDIGQGTTDIAIISDGSTASASTGIRMGIQDVLEKSLNSARNMDSYFKSADTVDFTKILNTEPKFPADIERKKTAIKAFKGQAEELVRKIQVQFEAILDVANNANIIYIFGGGSILLNQYSNLTEVLTATALKKGASEPIVWIDPKYAQQLNVLGLKYVLDMLYSEDN